MEGVYIIGIDLAKRSFQVHGARADGTVGFPQEVRSWGSSGLSGGAVSVRSGDGGLRGGALLGS